MCTERIYIDIYVISNNVNNIVHSACDLCVIIQCDQNKTKINQIL